MLHPIVGQYLKPIYVSIFPNTSSNHRVRPKETHHNLLLDDHPTNISALYIQTDSCKRKIK